MTNMQATQRTLDEQAAAVRRALAGKRFVYLTPGQVERIAQNTAPYRAMGEREPC